MALARKKLKKNADLHMEIKLPTVHLRPLSKESEFIEKRFAERGVKAQKKFLKKKFVSPCRFKKATYLCAPFRG